MSGYRPYMAGAREAAIRANRAAERRYRDAQYEEYRVYRAEQRACGYEVESFEEWLGEVNPREAAEARVMHGHDMAGFMRNADLF